MGDKTVSVRVRFEGGDQVKAGLQGVGREGTKMLQEIGTVSAATGAKLQNAGYQVSDFFVQVAGGTSPTRALAQQLPQLLQGFGLIGVAASVLVAALPSVWAMFDAGEGAAKALQEELDALRGAVDAYVSASDLAIEPLDKLIKKYGELAQSVRDARVQQAELARGDASRAVNSLLSGTETNFALGASSGELAQVVALEQGYARIRTLQASLTPEQARLFDFSADLAALDQTAGKLGDLRIRLQDMAAGYGVSVEQAAILAVLMDKVRDSAGKSAAEQVAAAEGLVAQFVEIYGSADAADQATGGLISRLTEAITTAADVAAAAGQIAGAIGAGADEAARLVTNLASARAYGKIQNSGLSGPDAARFSVMELNAGPAPGVIASGAGGYYKPPPGAGRGGGGGADQDQARALALTESLRSETEKYALALDEVNRLKQKGLITDETYNRQIDKLNEKLGKVGDLGKQAASAIRSAFDGLFDDPAAALKDLAKQLAMMALYQGLAQGLPGVFGAGGIIPLVGGGVPGFAAGGRHRGGLRIVGENGPELEATGPSMIYPNSALRAMGGGSSVSVNVQNYSGGEVQQRESRGPNGERTVDIMIGKSLTGGKQDQALRSRFGSRPATVKR